MKNALSLRCGLLSSKLAGQRHGQMRGFQKRTRRKQNRSPIRSIDGPTMKVMVRN